MHLFTIAYVGRVSNVAVASTKGYQHCVVCKFYSIQKEQIEACTVDDK